MIKKLLSLLICMTLMSSCATYAMPNDTVRTSDDVYTEAAAATIVTLAAATVMYDWVWAWNGAALFSSSILLERTTPLCTKALERTSACKAKALCTPSRQISSHPALWW